MYVIARILIALAIGALSSFLFAHIDDVPQIVRNSRVSMRRALDWLTAHSTLQTSDGDSGIGVVAGIVGVAVTQIIALIINEKNRESLSLASSGLWFYEAGNLLLLGMLFGVLRSKTLNSDGVTIRSFDMGTRHFVYGAMIWIAFGAMFAVPFVGAMGGFPTHQKKIKLALREPNTFTFKLGPYAGKEGLSFFVELRPADFDESIPEMLNLKITETVEFNGNWLVANMVTTEVLLSDGSWQKAATRQVPAVVETDEYASGASREVEFVVRHIEPTRTTRMTFHLLPRSPNGVVAAVRSAAKNALTTDHPIDVTVTAPPSQAPQQ